MDFQSQLDRFRTGRRLENKGVAFRPRWDRKFIFVCVAVTLIIVFGAFFHIAIWKADGLGEDIVHIWRDAHSISAGANPYILILFGNMRENDKYATYFPLFYLLGALTELLGFSTYKEWIHFWRWGFLLCNLGIALLLFIIVYRRGQVILALFSILFWLFSRWTLNLTTSGQIDFLPIFFLVASLALFERNQRLALLLFSFSLATKQIAIFLVPVYLIWIWQSSEQSAWKRLGEGMLIMFSVPLVTSLPFIIWNAEGFFKSIIFSATRLAENHFKVDSFDQLVAEGMPSFVGLPAKLPMLFLMGLVYIVAMRHMLGKYGAVLLILSVFVEFNSVLFRQYMTWIVPFIPLAVSEFSRNGWSSSLHLPARSAS